MEKISNIVFTEPQFNDQPSAWIEHIPFAFFLIEKLRPKTFVELGSQFGNSYFAFCQAISELKLPSKAFGVDIWLSYDEGSLTGRRIFEYANSVNSKHFSHFSNLLLMTFDEALEYFNDGEIDLLHIDGMHDYASVKHDFETWLPKMSDAGVIILHDSNVRENGFGVWKLADEIAGQYPNFSFNFGKGLTVVCIGKNVSASFIRFVNEAGTDPYIHQFFYALGSRWLYKNRLDLHVKHSNDSIQQLNSRIYQLEIQLQNKDSEIERIKSFAPIKTNENPPDSKAVLSLTQKLQNRIRVLSSVRKIEKSDLFDADFYLRKYPDVTKSGMKPARHYLLYGGFESRNPSDKFDTSLYLDQNPDVKASGLNPLLHYIRFGKAEGRPIRLS